MTAYRISTHTPLAGRDYALVESDDMELEISTHTPLAGRDHELCHPAHLICISTHTPLAGRDFTPPFRCDVATNFYSHAPCGT